MALHKKNSIREVAAAAGVSLSTASLALRHDPRVTAATRKKVLDAAASLQFVPDAAASRLRSGGPPPVGLLFHQNILAAGEMGLSTLGFAINFLTEVKREVRVLGCSNTDAGVEQLRMLGCKDVIIFNHYSETCGTPEKLAERKQELLRSYAGLRIFAINYHFFDERQTLDLDVYRFGIHRSRVQQLFNETLLRERPGRILLSNFNAMPKTLPDYVTTLADYRDGDPYQHGRDLAGLYLTQYLHTDVCAAMFGDDRVAAGFLTALTERGIRIPEQLAVAGFDDLAFGACLTVPLTSWAVPLKRHLLLALAVILHHADVPREVISVPQFSWRRSLLPGEANRRQLERQLQKEFVPEDDLKQYLKYFNPKEIV